MHPLLIAGPAIRDSKTLYRPIFVDGQWKALPVRWSEMGPQMSQIAAAQAVGERALGYRLPEGRPEMAQRAMQEAAAAASPQRSTPARQNRRDRRALKAIIKRNS